MPQNADGSVKLELWNYIERRVNRYFAKHGNETHVYVEDDDDEDGNNKRRRRKNRSKRQTKKEGFLSRIRRFLVTLIMTLLAVSSVLYTMHEVHSMAVTANHNLKSSIEVMQRHETRLDIDEGTIKHLNDSIRVVMDKVVKISHRLKADETVTEISLIMRRFFEEHRRIITGLSSLSANRLPPELVNMKSLTNTLQSMRSKIERQNMRMGIDKFHDIFSCDTSYAIYENGTSKNYVYRISYLISTTFSMDFRTRACLQLRG